MLLLCPEDAHQDENRILTETPAETSYISR